MRPSLKSLLPAALLLAAAPAAPAFQDAPPAEPGDAPPTFEGASASLDQELEAALAELARLREEVAADQVPLGKQLSALEAELSTVRREFQDASRTLETRTLDLGSLQGRIKALNEQSLYLSTLLSDYMRDFDASLHIAERDRYAHALDAAQLAVENTSLTEQEIFEAQLALVPLSMERLEHAIGGERFEGTALDPEGVQRHGAFLMVGPVAVFRSDDGELVGSVEQRVNSLEPTVYPFVDPTDASTASAVVAGSYGPLPIDPTLGNARKIEETSETFLEHVQKGGMVMIPIGVLAGAALLVALFKWLALSFVRKPSRKKLAALYEAIEERDEEEARRRVLEVKGPVGRMLRAGVDHLREPRELIEEVMFEQVLTTRLKLQRMLPFIAICAASAPLLGLLGTVTGIINTFKMITVFGSGDVKSLSGGISEALITTKFGLIVAIPSLLLHAFLSRKARGVVGRMETAAVAFVNKVGKAHFDSGDGAYPVEEPERDPEVERGRFRAELSEALEQLLEEKLEARLGGDRAELKPAPPGGAPREAADGVLVPRSAQQQPS